MTKEEMSGLSQIDSEKVAVIDASMLLNQNDRTLLYGYTCNRLTWHVYIKDRIIHKVIYGMGYGVPDYKPVSEYQVESNHDYVPDKRLYPECCDYEFCALLRQKDVYLPFTLYTNNRHEETFYGLILEDYGTVKDNPDFRRIFSRRQLLAISRPEAFNKESIAGIAGCPGHYVSLIDEPFYLHEEDCERPDFCDDGNTPENCKKCWSMRLARFRYYNDGTKECVFEEDNYGTK